MEEGNVLAQRVADELGENFVIERLEDDPNGRYRAKGPALNAQAAAAFDALALKLQAEDEKVARCIEAARRGESPRWYAYAPGSGTIFRPSDSPEDLKRRYPDDED